MHAADSRTQVYTSSKNGLPGIRTEVSDTHLDGVSQAITTIDSLHHEIHEGDAYSINFYDVSKGDGTTINAYFKTPNTSKRIHCFFQWSASGAAFGRILEAPTVTSNTGTNAKDIYNKNRNSSNTSEVVDNATSPAAGKFATDVTITGNGTILSVEYSGAAKSVGGESRNESEFVLKPNTAYVFQVESDAAGLTLALRVGWYEHSNN